jgi:hypothetical protein
LSELSFADYEAARKGESKAPEESDEKSATDSKSDQNESPESDPEENEAEETKDDEDEESESKEDDKPKKKGGVHRRIDKLVKAKAQAQQEAEYWREQAMKSSGQKAESKKVGSTPAVADDKPNPENFDTHAEYVEALTDWKITQKEKLQAQAAAESARKSEQEKAIKSHVERVKSFSKSVDDFSEVLESVDDIRVSETVEQAIIESENGPALMYELAKNREEFERINSLPPIAAARELGRIEARLTASTEKRSEAKKVTSAPRPVAPVGRSSGASVKPALNDPNIPFAEYERQRLAQLRRK